MTYVLRLPVDSSEARNRKTGLRIWDERTTIATVVPPSTFSRPQCYRADAASAENAQSGGLSAVTAPRPRAYDHAYLKRCARWIRPPSFTGSAFRRAGDVAISVVRALAGDGCRLRGHADCVPICGGEVSRDEPLPEVGHPHRIPRGQLFRARPFERQSQPQSRDHGSRGSARPRPRHHHPPIAPHDAGAKSAQVLSASTWIRNGASLPPYSTHAPLQWSASASESRHTCHSHHSISAPNLSHDRRPPRRLATRSQEIRR